MKHYITKTCRNNKIQEAALNIAITEVTKNNRWNIDQEPFQMKLSILPMRQ